MFFWSCVKLFLLAYFFKSGIGQDRRCHSTSEHQCQTDGRCILKEYVCDGTNDCFDGSDETTDVCLNRPCSQRLEHISRDNFGLAIGVRGISQSFRCSYGACISKRFICDGADNCQDGSDETHELCKNSQCAPDEFKCDYGACIRNIETCNGIQNCHDGSDETKKLCLNSRARRCFTSHSFKCDYGGCIPKMWKCNGRADCPDLSDEADCGPGHTYKVYPTMRLTQTTLSPPTLVDSAFTIPNNGLSKGCEQETAHGEQFETFDCGAADGSLCRGSGLLPFGTIIIVYCQGEADSYPLECRDDGLWHHIDNEGLAPSLIICQDNKPVKGCPGKAENVRVLVCGNSGSCDGTSSSYPIGTLILSQCGQSVLQCRDDTLWHAIREQIPPAYDACPNALAIADKGCPLGNPSYEVIICGSSARSCVGGSHLPRGTIVLATCNNQHSGLFLLQCYWDNKWYQLGQEAKAPMSRLCHYEDINTQECGERKERVVGFNWPWLVGLFREGKFACTGTLIGPSLVITGGHCVTRNQASSDAIAPNELIIQHAIPGGRSVKSKVSSIRVHPYYSGGDRPRFDVALVRLKYPAIRDNVIQPACLDMQGSLVGKVALTFNRTEGDEQYSWDLFSQTMDVTCINLDSICSRHLRIDDHQFCGFNKGNDQFLHPGSSGGPFLINQGTPAKEKWAIAGIVSHKVETKDVLRACKRPHTIFFSTSKVNQWIINCGYLNQCGV